MASGSRITVGTTATLLATGGAKDTTVVVKNGATAIDLGGAAVATGAGYAVGASEVTPQIVLGAHETLYGVSSAGTSSVSVLVTGF